MRDLSGKTDKFDLVHSAAETVSDEPRRMTASVFGISSSLVIILMFCAVIFSFGAVLFKVLVAEREAAMRETKSVARVFQNHKQLLLREMERYAASNAAYQNIDTNLSPDWIRTRFGVDMALDFAHDYTVLFGPGGKVLFSSNYHGKERAEDFSKSVQTGITGTLDSIRGNYVEALVRSEPGEVRFTGALADISAIDIVEINDHPFIVAAFAIVPDPGGIEMSFGPPNVLVNAFEIDAAHLSNLLSSLALDNLKFASEIPDGMIGTPVQNGSGTVLGYLAWYPMSQSSGIILSSIPVLLLSLGVILTVALIALRQNANARARLAAREQEARYAANHDSLTGFVTRGYFHATATKRLALSKDQQRGAWIIYLDVDNLKQVNDIYGHTVGDSLVVAQAERIRSVLGPFDLVARSGGDEFLILTERWETPEQAVEEAGKLFEKLRQPFDYEGKRIETSVSAGIARFPDHGQTLTGLVRAADIALQRCKMEQKSSFRIYDERMDDLLRERREIRVDLDSALREEQFDLFYQPIVDARSGELAFYEALIRWRHPSRGLVPPVMFLPVAQDAGLMPVIGAWVLERALHDACSWMQTGVSVNVCTSQIQATGFADKVEALLRKYDFPSERLVLEITEDLMLEESAQTRNTILKLRDLGVGLAIDDFGTGFSSLNYLHKYRFDKMKIDRSFVSRIGEDEEADMVVRSMLSLARVMGMQSVGEGVETEAQRDFLVEAGCEFLQGYLFDRPLPFNELMPPDPLSQMEGIRRAGG
ncbi:Cyclic di-GMP phosphodiesterase Gmr [Labrenzia sp. THAF191b]|uniref:putative bifunctional diguanylate cyclase/phosphodiesterase n=1 Tax=unclassified Labrenzia TaxID=2648686 RepID=UPI0012681958|nr:MULTISPECIES: EAL domain-containing protein [unclassified Labrenzia]QFS96757.1 Cyclic di-GMP phosphodiesterase Gmr [Labrenzia sp. THAF191b]QFT03072.1 Cyclic di-GMP phosphodiesterase Gmr [Labrenzia sp. THAF191a]QFT14614.1 Cyclic di-GMP phosphodiesterase Gmr [Labrenzia sp. THAF187b]